jgi:hypothetical protein
LRQETCWRRIFVGKQDVVDKAAELQVRIDLWSRADIVNFGIFRQPRSTGQHHDRKHLSRDVNRHFARHSGIPANAISPDADGRLIVHPFSTLVSLFPDVLELGMSRFKPLGGLSVPDWRAGLFSVVNLPCPLFRSMNTASGFSVDCPVVRRIYSD